jgi:hypothetical protein
MGGLGGQLAGYGDYAGGLAAGNVYPGLGTAQNQLTNFMSGMYASPSTNPYLQDYYNAAAAPVIANYQQAVAPNLLANAIGAGGLGSSGTASAFDAAQANLGTSLQNLASGMYEPAYQQGMQQMQAAIGMEPGMAQAWYTPLQQQLGINQQQQNELLNQANLYNQQAGLVGQQAGLVGQQAGMLGQQGQMVGNQAGLYGQQAGLVGQELGGVGQQMQGAQDILGVGGQQQQQLQNILNTAYQNLMQPYSMLGQAAGLLGPVTGGGGTQVTVGPNPMQSAK